MITSMRSRLPYVAFGLAAGLLVNAGIALAWTGPTDSAPNSNVSAPINVGTTAQIKNGDLGVNNISAFGNALLSGLGVGTGRYLNFDYTSAGSSGTGSSGYGIRDNAGTLEFKNSGGSWASLQSTITGLIGSGQWTTSGSNIYNSNAGNVGIGVSGPSYKLDISDTARASAFIYSSDKRLKNDIQPIKDSLSKVLQITGVSFSWKSGNKKGKADIGVIAQDVQKVLPEAVSEDSQTHMLSVDYPRLVPILINSIKEQQKEIEELTARLEALEAKLGSQ